MIVRPTTQNEATNMFADKCDRSPRPSKNRKRADAERKHESRRAERDFCPKPLEREKPAATMLTANQWDALRVAVINGDREAFEHLVGEIAKTAARDEIARRVAGRQAGYVNGRAYSILDR